jgi:pyruvate/2-oxoglutarate dehydrogenase complex dihydrolipoamide acyltransferase (E2) component
MSEKITMPKLGSSMVSGMVTSWIKKEGEHVKKGEPVVEVETDKITNQVESPIDGYVLKIYAEEGEERNILETLAVIGEKGEI